MKYLEPEPVLQDPMFATLRAEDGASLPVYSYASNNPITRYDDNGLHDTNGCENGSTCDDCAKQAASITDPAVRACVIAQCRSKNIKLKCDKKSKKKASCGPIEGGTSGGGFDPKKKNEVLWCEVNLDQSCQAKLVVHELAHSCKWNDGGGKGVPDYAPGTSPDVDLLQCHPQASGTSGE